LVSDIARHGRIQANSQNFEIEMDQRERQRE
jgi:hypothetical protein